MITVRKDIELIATDDATSFVYAVSVSDSCIGVTPSSGSVAGTSDVINFTFTFEDSSCFVHDITILRRDNNGCEETLTFLVENPCTDISMSLTNTTTNNNPFVFVPNITDGTAPYTYRWTWDTTLFDEVAPVRGDAGVPGRSSTLTLTLRDGVSVPSSTYVTLQLTDGSGCQTTATYVYTFCAPQAVSTSVIANCGAVLTSIAGCNNPDRTVRVELETTGCDSFDIDWSTAQFTTPSGVCVNQVSDNIFTFYIESTYSDSTANITWSVENEIGVASNDATISISVPDPCELEIEILAPTQRVQMTTDELAPGSELFIPLNPVYKDEISGADPNWSSFTFAAATGQSLVSATELTATNGTAELTADREVKYTVGGAINDNVDLVQYTIENNNGQISNTGKIYIDAVPSTAPSVSADSITVASGQSNSINVLDNDTGNINPSSIQVVTAPSNVNYSLDSSGNLSVTANSREPDGSDSLVYKVANTDGVYSSNATVTITIIHAGLDSINNLCEETTVDLTGLRGSPAVTAGGVWAGDASNPSVLSLVDPTNVDFTGADEGAYTFSYTVTDSGETDVAYVTINFTNYQVTHTATILLDPAGTDPNSARARFNITGLSAVVSFSSILIDVHRDTSPITPGPSNLIDTVSPTSYDTSTGIIIVDYELPISAGNSYVFVCRVTPPCGTPELSVTGTEVTPS